MIYKLNVRELVY